MVVKGTHAPIFSCCGSPGPLLASNQPHAFSRKPALFYGIGF
jgi:hypothetical protein